jgi:hypothetical protein
MATNTAYWVNQKKKTNWLLLNNLIQLCKIMTCTTKHNMHKNTYTIILVMVTLVISTILIPPDLGMKFAYAGHLNCAATPDSSHCYASSSINQQNRAIRQIFYQRILPLVVPVIQVPLAQIIIQTYLIGWTWIKMTGLNLDLSQVIKELHANLMI